MDGVLNRYGVEAILQTVAGEKTLKVIFYSINSSAWQNMQRVFFPLGEVPRGQYICILPVSSAPAEEDTLVVCGQRYLLRKVEQMSAFTGPMYCWALCTQEGSEDTWGLNGSTEA